MKITIYVFIKRNDKFFREYEVKAVPRIGEDLWISNEKYEVVGVEHELDNSVVYIKVLPYINL